MVGGLFQSLPLKRMGLKVLVNFSLIYEVVGAGMRSKKVLVDTRREAGCRS